MAGLVGRFDVANIKLDKCGGLTEGLLMAAFAGLHLPLMIWLAAAPDAVPAGGSLRRFVAVCGLATLTPDPRAVERLRGANTPAERAVLLRTLS